jgi:putative drug exporter of the RND superfamily
VTVPGSVSTSNAAARDVMTGVRASFSRADAPSGLSFHLTGPLAVSVNSGSTEGSSIANFTLLFVIMVLFVLYRAALAPLITLVPAALAVLISGPIIAEAMARAGVAVPPSAQPVLIVLLLGAGTDYGLFLAFRFREELAGGRGQREALVASVQRVGQAVMYLG